MIRAALASVAARVKEGNFASKMLPGWFSAERGVQFLIADSGNLSPK